MGLSLERQTLLTARSERVKCIDFHPNEPWVLASLYSGVVTIWNYETQAMVRSIEVSDMPIRTARFIARKNWIIVGADDMQIRVYNYHTSEKVTQFEAHSDYIRQFAIHPNRPLVLSCSDDMTVRLWDWERGWKCVNTFEGHSHYVMAVVFNPKDPNVFATASLDRTIKVWSLGNLQANFTMEGHEKGVNCLDYYPGGDRPYLVSGGDDGVVRIWDYQTKTCLRVLEGHLQNVTSVIYHADLPLLFSASEDGTVRIWNSNSFRSESTFNPSLDRLWAVTLRRGSAGGGTEVAIGGDEGTVVFQLGKGVPAVSLDVQSGKLIWAHHSEIFLGNIRQALTLEDKDLPDGSRIALSRKELGRSDLYPSSVIHSLNGKFAAVMGDGEYVIYSTLAWRNRSFGKALELVWSSTPEAHSSSNDYATRESPSLLRIYRNFSEAAAIRMTTPCDALHGGPLLGAACAGGQLCFLDWSSGQVVGRIDVDANKVYWSEAGTRLAICTADGIYLVACDLELINRRLKTESIITEEGIQEAFELIGQIEGTRVTSAAWIDDNVLVFVSSSMEGGGTTAGHRLAYTVLGTSNTTVHQVALLDRPLFLLGFLAEEGRLVLVDREAIPYLYNLSQAVLAYQAAILRGDYKKAHDLVSHVPTDQLNSLARFLASEGHLEEALNMATDDELRFTLALELRKLDLAFELASRGDSPLQWRQLGELALRQWKVSLAERCFIKCDDLPTLLLIYTSTGNTNGLLAVSKQAIELGHLNVAFTALFSAGHREECLDLLIEGERYPEAALFARTYLPEAIERTVKLWKESLRVKKHRAAELIADPLNRPELFPEINNFSLPTDRVSVLSGHSQKSSSRVTFDNYTSNNNNSSTPGNFTNFDVPSTTGGGSSSTVPAYEAAYSDHMSMEVNTGTGSMRADDLDDLASVTISESRDDPLVVASRNLEKLSIQELEEEHRLPSDDLGETEGKASHFTGLQDELSFEDRLGSSLTDEDEFAEPLAEDEDEDEIHEGDKSGKHENINVRDSRNIHDGGFEKDTAEDEDHRKKKTESSLPPISFDDDGWD